jgi:Mrp family chromosome partitioning ATPase
MLPKRLAHLLPKLQTSDYDYIIFDMPAVTQTSITPRLAAFMDMMFIVVEDEKTNREWIKQASRLLQQSKANVGAVFNKRRTYTPRWLHQEF